jgi:hypothetical protein
MHGLRYLLRTRLGHIWGTSTEIDMSFVYFSKGYSDFLIDTTSTTLTSSEIHGRSRARLMRAFSWILRYEKK